MRSRRPIDRSFRSSPSGRFRVEGSEGPLNGDWLEQRPGELLKYFVSERRRVLPSDRIAEALWPEAGIEEGRNRLRHYVHALRERLATGPGVALARPRHCCPPWRLSLRYQRDLDRCRCLRARGTRRSVFPRPGGRRSLAASHLVAALSLYQGDFLTEEPDAEWALDERERLRELAGRALTGEGGPWRRKREILRRRRITRVGSWAWSLWIATCRSCSSRSA